MRILHVIPSLDPATGGPPIVASRLAAAQAAAGCSVRIVAYRFPDAEQRTRQALANIPGFSDVIVDLLPPLTRAERLFARAARRQLQEPVRQADIVHLHGVWDPVIRAASLAADAAPRPCVITVHGMLDPWALSQKAAKKRLALFLGYRAMLNHASLLHFLNEDERRLTAPLRLTAPTCIIPNGIFLQEIDPLPQRGAFRRAHPAVGDRPFVLFLSRLHYKKGLDYLAAAFARLAAAHPDAQLVVAGPDGGAQADFQKQIQALGVAPRVHIVGPLYGEQKIQAMVDCDCFCLPSRQEGFSIAITEALACGAPVVISQACHFPEVASAGAGLVTPLDPPAIADALDKILSSPPAAAAMGAAGKALVRAHYTWDAIAKTLIAQYQKIRGNNPAA